MAKEAPGRNGFKYRSRYGIIILCEDEKAQETLFYKLKAEGYKIKVVTV
ncbi:MAG: hypothetical protein LBD67_06455 [Candidatus Accumulibacter sp.]|jgi:hypothetical protein|nr:hypothetical protein [Accumulibacter sp.]